MTVELYSSFFFSNWVCRSLISCVSLRLASSAFLRCLYKLALLISFSKLIFSKVFNLIAIFSVFNSETSLPQSDLSLNTSNSNYSIFAFWCLFISFSVILSFCNFYNSLFNFTILDRYSSSCFSDKIPCFFTSFYKSSNFNCTLCFSSHYLNTCAR
jgi:hypothetical protein